MPCPLLIISQSDYLIQIIEINSRTYWQTLQTQISWLLQKPTDLGLHCLQRQDISGFSRTRVNINDLHCLQKQDISEFSRTRVNINDARLDSDQQFNNTPVTPAPFPPPPTAPLMQGKVGFAGAMYYFVFLL